MDQEILGVYIHDGRAALVCHMGRWAQIKKALIMVPGQQRGVALDS